MQPNFCLRDKVSPRGNGLRAQSHLFCLFPFVGFLFLLLVQYQLKAAGFVCSLSLVSYFCYLFNVVNFVVCFPSMSCFSPHY
ncbi:unnamed protein product, partial [Prunus brigantina]